LEVFGDGTQFGSRDEGKRKKKCRLHRFRRIIGPIISRAKKRSPAKPRFHNQIMLSSIAAAPKPSRGKEEKKGKKEEIHRSLKLLFLDLHSVCRIKKSLLDR